MNYSFFHAKGGAGHIRGIQMANKLGGKLNPTEGYENDICIWVKINTPEEPPEHTYYDIVDAFDHRQFVKDRPDLKVIVAGDLQEEYMASQYKNELIKIPVPHCNDERILRPDREVKTVGILGGRYAFISDIAELEKKFEAIGLKLIWAKRYWHQFNNEPTPEGKDSREKVSTYYQMMDINITFRPYGVFAPFKTPLKLANAGAFGIPTVSYPEDNYVKEWNGDFVPATTVDELVAQCKKLADDTGYYKEMASRALQRAEEYHVDHILDLYRKLI